MIKISSILLQLLVIAIVVLQIYAVAEPDPGQQGYGHQGGHYGGGHQGGHYGGEHQGGHHGGHYGGGHGGHGGHYGGHKY